MLTLLVSRTATGNSATKAITIYHASGSIKIIAIGFENTNARGAKAEKMLFQQSDTIFHHCFSLRRQKPLRHLSQKHA
jgi:hypothetical protein